MKTLHRYLLRQIIATLVMTMLVFTFVLLVGSALRELLPLLVNGQATFLMVAEAFGLLIPFVFAFALPMAMLTSTILVFERFSGDQELTAARASGVSLVSLSAPILILSLFLCGLSAFINMNMAPACRVAYNGLRSDMRSTLANFKLPEGQTDLPAAKPGDHSYTINVRRNRNQNLQDVTIFDYQDETNNRAIYAPTAHLLVDITNQQIILYLTNVTIRISPGDTAAFGAEYQLPVKLGPEGRNNVGFNDMTFGQLRDELRKRSFSPPLPLDKGTNAASAEAVKKKKARTLADTTEPIRMQIHKEVAFSFACFGFTLIGIPLGIRVQRRETKIGLFIAIGLFIVYYALQIVGQSLAGHPQYAPHLLMWVPNLIFQAIGAVLLWRANRGL